MDSSKIITRPVPAMIEDLDRQFATVMLLNSRLLNIATGLAVVVEELRDQIMAAHACPDGLPKSEHLDNLKAELSSMRAAFNPSRQQRRAAMRGAK